MDPLIQPKFLLLMLEQGDRYLEDHTRLFLMLANATSYPDDAICAFYDASLNTTCRALSSEDGPREDFATYVEWTLARKGLPLVEIPSCPRAQPTISQQSRASARAHRWWRAISRCDLRASTKPSDWEEDRPGSWAQPLRPGARASDSAHHEGASHGRCERGVEPPAPRLRVSWLYIWDCWTGLPILQCPLLESALQCPLLENARPPTRSCRLHSRCLAATPLRPQPPICTVRAPRVCHPPALPGLEYPSPQPPRPGLCLCQ